MSLNFYAEEEDNSKEESVNNYKYLFTSFENKLPTLSEALNQMFGTGINDVGSKQKAEEFGVWGARAGELAGAGVVGLGAGATALGLGKLFTPELVTKHIPKNSFVKWGSKFGTWAKAGALLFAAGDLMWQLSRS